MLIVCLYVLYIHVHDLKEFVCFHCSPLVSESSNPLISDKQYIIFIQLSCFIFRIQFESQSSHHGSKHSTPLVFQRGRHYMIAIRVIVGKASLIDELHKRPDSQAVK